MSLAIAMPQLGLTMTEGTVSSWRKNTGDTVSKDEIILVISTDKVDMDVEAPADGVIERIVVESGETVPVGTPLAYLLRPGEKPDTMLLVDEDPPEDTTLTPADPLPLPPPPAASPTLSGPALARGMEAEVPDPDISDPSTQEFKAPELKLQQAETLPPQIGDRAGRIVASPRAKKMASAFGIDLSSINGSGPRGRISAEDVERSKLKAVEKKPLEKQIVDGDTKRRRIIADRMVESITTIPAFSVSLEVNAEHLVSVYESIKKPIGQAAETKLTYTDLLLKALGIALAETPAVNTLWEGGTLRRLNSIALGLAVATDRGVVAPTLGDVDRISLEHLVRQRAHLTGKARESRLSFADLEGASGTLSNLGMYRVDHFQGIITPGQTFILAVGRLRKRPWVEEVLTVKPTIILNLSVDHRVADGAAASVFLERVADLVESPYQLLLERKPAALRSMGA